MPEVTRFVARLAGAAALNPRTYEEVEADRGATGQAIAVVLLASLATAVGLPGVDPLSPMSLAVGLAGALAGWIAWAILTYTIGTRLLPEPQTRADAGELLRTLAFAASPGLLRVLGAVPPLAVTVYAVTAVWMLAAMIVAVRQALDYRSTARAAAVCIIGWAVSLVLAALIAFAFAQPVS
jgi:hypothetical protein